MARPKGSTGFADDQVEELLDRTSKGETLTSVCSDPRMPSRTTVFNWTENDPAFAERFRSARAKGVHALAEECLAIADEPVNKDDSVAVANKRVRIDTRLRLAGKWLSSEYGDKLDINTKSEVIHRHDLSRASDADLDAAEELVRRLADASGDTSGEGAAQPRVVH